jgi:hypothetical protein
MITPVPGRIVTPVPGQPGAVPIVAQHASMGSSGMMGPPMNGPPMNGPPMNGPPMGSPMNGPPMGGPGMGRSPEPLRPLSSIGALVNSQSASGSHPSLVYPVAGAVDVTERVRAVAPGLRGETALVTIGRSRTPIYLAIAVSLAAAATVVGVLVFRGKSVEDVASAPSSARQADPPPPATAGESPAGKAAGSAKAAGDSPDPAKPEDSAKTAGDSPKPAESSKPEDSARTAGDPTKPADSGTKPDDPGKTAVEEPGKSDPAKSDAAKSDAAKADAAKADAAKSDAVKSDAAKVDDPARKKPPRNLRPPPRVKPPRVTPPKPKTDPEKDPKWTPDSPFLPVRPPDKK